MDFQHHPSFLEELDKFVRKHCYNGITVEIALKHIENLLISHFERKCSISPNHLGRAPGFGAYTIYFYRLFIGNCNLRRTQHPKSYFYMQESTISILCCDSHIDDYKDAKLRDTAKERLHEMLEVFKSE